MLETINFLNHNTVEDLTSQFGINVSEHESGLIVLNYDQIVSPKTHPITKECRSLVVSNEMGEWHVVSRSFDRFFNYGELGNEDVDVQNMTAYEKLDGSLLSLFYFNGEWMYRTRSMINPKTKVNGFTKTWNEFIEPNLFNDKFDESLLDKSLTYVFEIVGFFNRVVTRYDQENVFLLAIRNNVTGCYVEVDDTLCDSQGWLRPKKYTFGTISDCIIASKSLPNLEEGYVLYNNTGVPVLKVKNPAYVAAHRIRGNGLTTNRIVELILINEHPEYLSIFPEDKEHFQKYIDMLELFTFEMNENYNAVSGIECQKEFAISVKDKPYSHVLFKARIKQTTPKVIFDEMTIQEKFKTFMNFINKNEGIING